MKESKILCVGIGGAGSRIAPAAAAELGADCLLVSNDRRDLEGADSIHVGTGSLVNPSAQAIRGYAGAHTGQMRRAISGHGTVILVANLAGRAGAGIAPLLSKECARMGINTISFAIMPFRYEKDRIFGSGVALSRLQEDSGCCIILDNDAMIEANPELAQTECHKLSNAAIHHAMISIGASEIDGSAVLCTGREGLGAREALRDSLRMLYQSVHPEDVRRAVLYVSGSAPVGIMDAMSQMTSDALNRDTPVADISANAGGSGIVLLSEVQALTRFARYDPLQVIPRDSMLDWDEPDCSMDCGLEFHQLE